MFMVVAALSIEWVRPRGRTKGVLYANRRVF
jgi:hypothetical protein